MGMNEPQGLPRIIDVYFRSAQSQTFSAGDVLLQQGENNHRVYWIESGTVAGFLNDDQFDESPLFTLSNNTFFGVHSFFAQTGIASSTIVAVSSGLVRWIDDKTKAQQPERFGSLIEQFMPIMVHELAQRQRQTECQAREKQKALEITNATEQMAILGQLAAGLAHELNNAISVLSHKTQILEKALSSLIADHQPKYYGIFELGQSKGQVIDSKSVRLRGKWLSHQYSVSFNDAKKLAKLQPQGDIPKVWLTALPTTLYYGSLGRDCYDLRVASHHATQIVRSVKQLGGGELNDKTTLDVASTLQKALALLSKELRSVDLKLTIQSSFSLVASEMHLVQVWVNLIKNACEAMGQTRLPILGITLGESDAYYWVTLQNNGPQIPIELISKIFQPDFTTKKGGLSFGLGLGLSIVKRIVQETGGELRVKSNVSTIFSVTWSK
jgi:hypothetical protein